MSGPDILKVVIGFIAALGGGGAIVLGLSNFLGKIWADRYAQQNEQEHERELEKLKADFEVWKTKTVGAHEQKVAIYQQVANILAEIVVDIVAAQKHIRQLSPQDAANLTIQFEKDRLKAYAYLAMLAPQSVMDKYDAVIDYLSDHLEGSRQFVFVDFRPIAIAMLNAIRVDLGIDANPIEYRGKR